MSLIRPRSAVLRTALSPQEVAARLAEITDGPLTFFGSRPLVGSVSPASLSLRKRIGYRNSWQTVLTATLEGQKGQTTIRCRFWMHILVVAFMAVWFVLAIGGLFGVMGAGLEGGLPVWATLIPLGLFGFGWLMLYVGRWLARQEESYLVETLRSTLDATVVEREPGYENLDAAAMERLTSAGVRPMVVVAVVGVLLALGVMGAVFYALGAPS